MACREVHQLGEGVAMTNADRVRKMTDEELLDAIYRFMGNAAACLIVFTAMEKSA